MPSSDEQLILVVLGAGTSAGCGFPMGADFFASLQAYGASLPDTCQKLRIAIDHVVAEAKQSASLTVDDLARVALLRRGGGMENYRRAWRTLSLARIATDAFFLHLESQIDRATMESMKDLWHEMLGPSTDESAYEFPPTKYRLLSFNYDRVPEITFTRFFSGGSNIQFDTYSSQVLNCGLNNREGPTFRQDSFCYLKLHGTIGVEPIGPNERVFQDHFRHYASFTRPESSFQVSDSVYFKDETDADGLPTWKVMPLIVFPADKQRIEAGGQDYNSAEYVNAIREQAEKVFQQAAQIRIIGYSFHPADKQWLVSLLRLAPDAKKIVVNPHAEEICEELRTYDDLTNVHALRRRWGNRWAFQREPARNGRRTTVRNMASV
jgi:hypothetical protein